MPKNITVSQNNQNYCKAESGCNISFITPYSNPTTCGTSDATTTDVKCGLERSNSTTSCFDGSIKNDFLDIKNEFTQFVEINITNENTYSNPYFIGSLATNKCVSRFGIQDPFAATSQRTGSPFDASESNAALGIILMDTFSQDLADPTGNGSGGLLFRPVSNNLDLGVIHDYESYGSALASFGSDAGSVYTQVGKSRSLHYVCYASSEAFGRNLFTDNYYYLNLNKNLGNINSCKDTTKDSGPYVSPVPPQKSFDEIPGFLPVMGIPLTNYALGNGQQSVMFSSFLGKEFNQNPTENLTYVRSYVQDSNPINGVNKAINMTTGIGSRWSFELSETPEINSGASVLCGVEAER
jgi:hypothetical protein